MTASNGGPRQPTDRSGTWSPGAIRYEPNSYWAPQDYETSPPLAGSKHGMRWALVTVLVALLLGGTAALMFVEMRHHHHADGPVDQSACAVETAPAGASPAAIAYVAAVNKTVPAREQLTATIKSQGGMIYHLDLRSEAQIDSAFLDDLRAIRFPSDASPVATAFESDLGAYIELLHVSFANPGYFAAHPDVTASLDSERSADAAQLRDVLGLPPSNCAFLRP